VDEPELILSIETADGLFLRPVMAATRLSTDVPQGDAAEDATRRAAASWGLPDFVFRSSRQSRGSRNRELGDCIVVVGDRAGSIQVKSRVAASGVEAKERSWLDRKIAEGARQASGTIRSLTRAGRVLLTNERGRTVDLEVGRRAWLKVVVIDHPGLTGYVPPRVDAVVLLRRDWEFLFGQLKSTYAVLEYVQRVQDDDPVVLGEEPVRYFQYARADAAAPPGEGDPRLMALGASSTLTSLPLLPQAPAGHGDDAYHRIIRIVLEDVALAGVADEGIRLEVLAAIDAIPVAYRAELGKVILSWIDEAAAVPEGSHLWRFRSIPWPGRPYLLFGAATTHSEAIETFFGDYVTLRHQQQIELMPERAHMLTVGVLLTPRHDGHRPWDTTTAATRGDQGFHPKFREALELMWGPMGRMAIGDVNWDKVNAAFKAAGEAQAVRDADA
jgi:hypothetical protein